MCFRDVAFLSNRCCFHTTYVKNCQNLGATARLKTVVGVRVMWLGVCNGIPPVKHICSRKSFLW